MWPQAPQFILRRTVSSNERPEPCTPSSAPSSPRPTSVISSAPSRAPAATLPPARVSHPRSGDTLYMPSRLTSSHFVGRVGELAELELAVREATAGRPTLVLLGGDSGVGKTRLVGELEHRLAGENGERPLMLRGDGVEQDDGELPYAPLLSALRPLVRERHPALSALSPGGRQQLAAV